MLASYDTAPATERRRVPTADAFLAGELIIPADARRVVVLAGARRRAVADRLAAAGIAVLSLELLTDEEATGSPPDAGRLARRLVAAIDWLDLQRELRGLPVACCGEGAAAAAALIAARARERVSTLSADRLSGPGPLSAGSGSPARRCRRGPLRAGAAGRTP